jgi:aminoglycoside phosphotransferase (APT) family kinase protein
LASNAQDRIGLHRWSHQLRAPAKITILAQPRNRRPDARSHETAALPANESRLESWPATEFRSKEKRLRRPPGQGCSVGVEAAAAAGILACVTTKMHADEFEIDEPLVRRLLAKQFPDWGSLPLRRIEPGGTDHAIFRLGDELSVRLPRVNGPTEPGGKEFTWLPKLAPLLPVEVPVPIAQGRPGEGFPWFWEIHTWVRGETVPIETIDAIQVARDLAVLIEALQRIDSGGAPAGRGIPLAERDEGVRYWLARFDGDPRVTAEWERAAAAPPWDGPPVWHHGDLDARNWLICGRRISGVIDWGSMGVGDPACDLMVAWKLHSPAAHDAFREALPADDATWDRARGWVLSQAVAILAYYTPENNPTLFHEAESWLELVLSEQAR